jgi:hypothetical protein
MAGRAKLLLVACLGLILAAWGLVLTWLISGDLQIETVAVMIVFSVMLLGITVVSRIGRTNLAAWLLIALLGVVTAYNATYYGIGAPDIVFFALPIILAACLIGLSAGMIMAIIGTIVTWGIAIGAMQGWLEVAAPFQTDHLTFYAPVITVLFLLVALIVGWWSRYISTLIKRT